MQDAGLHGIYPPRCGAVGELRVGATVVTAFVCTLDFGHGDFGIAHESTISWHDDAIVTFPDADLLDPDEVMVDPLGEACPACGRRHPSPASPGVCDQ